MKQIILDKHEIDLRLEEIKIEKENIIKIYDYYFDSEERFTSDKIMNLIVILNRRNHQLMEQVNLEKRRFLSAYNIINHKYISALNEWISGDNTKIDILKVNPNFFICENILNDLLIEKKSNDLLLCEVNKILDEEKLLLMNKSANEKRHKKRLLFKQKNAKMK